MNRKQRRAAGRRRPLGVVEALEADGWSVTFRLGGDDDEQARAEAEVVPDVQELAS